MSDTDGIDEAFAGQVRVAVTAAAHVAEGFARGWQEARRRADAASEREARELTSRLEAERQTARADVGASAQTHWWDRATPDDVGRVYAAALAFEREGEPWAVEARSRLDDQLRTRYGIDADALQRDPSAVREAVATVDAHRVDGRGETAEATRLFADANRADMDAARDRAHASAETDATARARSEQERSEADASRLRERAAGEASLGDQDAADVVDERRAVARDPDLAEDRVADAQAEAARHDDRSRNLYDSAERRAGDADRLRTAGVDPKAADARMRSDVAQGRSATEAVERGSTPQRARSHGQQQTNQRRQQRSR